MHNVLRYREIPPVSALRPFLSTFWLLELDSAAAAPQRIVPDGRSELILNLAEPYRAFSNGRWHPQPRCFFAGQIDGPLLLKPGGPTKILGIGFHPHGASALLGQPMHELSGSFTAIDDLSPRLARDLMRALDSPDPIPIVEGALLAAPGKSPATDPLVAEAVRRLFNSPRALDISVLAHDLALSTRQFERRFRSAVGLAPKLFSKIQRFSKVFRVLEAPSRDWVDTALACGYYDQAHLIRDCKRFSGATPAALLAEDGDLARHFYRRYGVSHSSNTAARHSA